MEWRKSDGFGCLNWISAPEKWLYGQKHIRDGIFTHRLTHNPVITRMVGDEMHGQALYKKAIQSPNHERDTLTDVTEKVRKAQKVNPALQPWVLFTRIETNKPSKVKDAIELDKFLRSDLVWVQPLKTRLSALDIFESACNEGAGVHDVARGNSLGKAKGQIELFANEIGIL